MRVKNKKTIKIIFSLVVVFAIIAFVSTSVFNLNNSKIDRILSGEDYSYLPIEAKKYLKGVYEETGEVILTEKNKEVNELYLNPQYVEYLTYSDEEKEKIGEIPISMIIDYSIREETKNINVPSSYDMRENYVTPVRDQGTLGLCWAFATAGVAESYLLQNVEGITMESPVLISERQIDYVTSRNGINDFNSEYVSFINRSLGDGGNFYISTIAMANGVSLYNYNSFKKYDDHDLTKMELSDVINYDYSKYEVNSTINVPRMNLRESTSILTEEEIEIRNSYLKEVKQNIMENGGAYVNTFMSSSCQYTDANLNNLVIDVYNCSKSGGHAMQIIGWDDNLEYSYCADTLTHKANISNCNNVIKGKGVWLLKNSWGDELQYPYLTYDSLYSSIHFIDEMSSTDNKTWDNNYVLGNSTENINEKAYYLKDTKIKDNEKIEKIKFITEVPDSTYYVKVYKKDGGYETFSKKNELPGLITIDITEDIVVDKNTKIIISSESSYIDKVSVFTSNIDTTPYINLEKYNNIEILDRQIRLYSETKNIPSNTEIIYKLYNSENQEITEKVTFTNNVVAENNINTLASFSNELNDGDYRIDVIYNANVIASVNIKIVKMQGQGTKENPYIITNSTQLNQIREDLDGYYELANDIDLTEDTREGGKLSLASNTCPQGFGWESINGFSGTLDGKGHTIKGLYQNNYLKCNIDGDGWKEWQMNGNGLFATAYGNVTIKNLVLEDFDVNCTETKNVQYNSCGALLSDYNASNDSYDDKNVYNATFENIVLRNSNIHNTSGRTTYGGGLFGLLESYNGNISISNIYLDFELEPNNFGDKAYLASFIQGINVDIKNIQLKGNIVGKYSDGSGDSVLVDRLIDNSALDENVTVKNVLSTVTGKNVSGILFDQASHAVIDGVNVLNIEDKSLCRTDCSNATNVNIYNKDTELYKLTDKDNYSTWVNFDDNWVIETIDGIPRLPVLKFVDFEYTNIDDIYIEQELNTHKTIYEYIEPNIDSAKRIIYKSNNEEIVKIDENGVIIPQSSGNTTIHIESYYDGYIKDVPITINYKPHYTIHFDSNDTEDYYKDIEGAMESIEVETGKTITLPANQFAQEYYEFKEWNTKADGTGISYSDLSEIPAMNDKEEITLYVQWWGKERIVTFDANGGNVNPDRKMVRLRSEYGELPIPTREGYGFKYWSGGNTSVYAFARLNGLELTAHWVEDAYTIIYDANGGMIQDDYKHKSGVYKISESLATEPAKNNQDYTIYENIYKNPSYKFKEWNTEKDGTGTSYSIGETIKLSNVENDTLRLYAIWEKQTYSVTFDANEGLFADNKSTIVFDVWEDSKLDTIEKPTRNGYVFKGYYTEKTGGTSLEKYIAEAGFDRDGLVFYAQWEKTKFILKFDLNGGIGTMNPQEFDYDTSQKIIKNTFTKTGHNFSKWNTKADGTGTSYTDEQVISISEDLVLYAQWSPQTYKLTYDSNSGEGTMDKQTFTYNVESILFDVKFSKDGYVFKEWNTKADGTGTTYTNKQSIKISADTTIYAIWVEGTAYVINKYSVDENNKYIDLIDINTTVEDFKKNINVSNGYTVDVEYKSVNGKNILYTGGKTKIYKNNELYAEYTNIIRGDVNGNATIDIIDYIRIMKHIMEEIVLKDEVYKAADVNQNNAIDIIDYIRIMKKIMEEN